MKTGEKKDIQAYFSLNLAVEPKNMKYRFNWKVPVVPVTDLAIKDNDLVAATAGRAFWVLDDLSPVQEAANVLAGKQLKIISPKATIRYKGAGSGQTQDDVLGKNPVEGVILDYYIPSKPDGEVVKLAIQNAAGMNR
ncbi:MAG: hypothetical protein PHD73_08420, partial [Sediminibacterium sp.]|nr:hypothetical protein [Sediminibacterium sp.]